MSRSLALILAALCFGGCSSTITTTTLSPANTVLPLTVQRNEAQAGIAVAKGIEAASLFAAVLQSIDSSDAVEPRTAPCKDGVEKTVVVTSPESIKITIDVFYEKDCKHLLTHAVLDASFITPKSVSITGRQTRYSLQGAAVAYGKFKATIALTASGGHSVITGTLSASQGGPAILAFGLTCTFANRNDCGFGGISAVASLKNSIGVSAMLDGFIGAGKTNNGTATLKAYSGALGSLSLARGPGDSWTIKGGSLVVAQTGPFKESVNANTLAVTGNAALEDQGAGAGVDVPFGTRIGIVDATVNVLASGATNASFAVNPTGSGSITYSNGSVGKIVLFIITS